MPDRHVDIVSPMTCSHLLLLCYYWLWISALDCAMLILYVWLRFTSSHFVMPDVPLRNSSPNFVMPDVSEHLAHPPCFRRRIRRLRVCLPLACVRCAHVCFKACRACPHVRKSASGLNCLGAPLALEEHALRGEGASCESNLKHGRCPPVWSCPGGSIHPTNSSQPTFP